jgi:SAM-dependent methyltransferase
MRIEWEDGFRMNRDRAALEQEMRRYDWYHRIDLGSGLITPGRDYDFMWRPTMEFMRGCCFEGKRVLDVGCWDGMFSFFVEGQGAEAVVGTDIEFLPTQRFAADVLGSKVQFQRASVYRLARAFPPESFDVVVFNGVLYHLMLPLLALLAINRVLKPGGKLLMESAYYSAEELRPFIFVSFGEDQLYEAYRSSGSVPSMMVFLPRLARALCRLVGGVVQLQCRAAGRLLIEATKTASAEAKPYSFYEYKYDVLDL